jgi:hypothetical protein
MFRGYLSSFNRHMRRRIHARHGIYQVSTEVK